tara:strand:- start:3076 stop:3564 length:489 start_codon:yes stop_codon:yes gene_type:complete
MVLTFKLGDKIFIKISRCYSDIKYHVLMVPLLDKGMQSILVFKEDREVLLHPTSKVYIQCSRGNLFKGKVEFLSTTLKDTQCIFNNEDTSFLSSYSTGSSFLPLIQQDVSVGATIEVPLSPIAGSGVASPWVGFASHLQFPLDTVAATGYHHNTMVALPTEE